ncbi:MAG: hypothetical protein RIR70_1651 [Pseudomonadota bacterium]
MSRSARFVFAPALNIQFGIVPHCRSHLRTLHPYG